MRIGTVYPDTKLFSKFLKNNNLISEHVFNLLLLSDNVERYDTPFMNRIIFPVYDKSGEAQFYGGRSINRSRNKYLYSRNGDYISKSNILYNYNNCVNDNKLYVFEGPFDVWQAIQKGYNNSVAILGSNFSDNQIKQLESHKSEIIIGLDNDDSGNLEVITLLKNNPKIRNKSRIIKFPLNQDADSFLLKNEQSLEEIEVESNFFLSNYITNNCDLSYIVNRMKLKNDIFDLIYESNDLFVEGYEILESTIGISIPNLKIDYEKYKNKKSNSYLEGLLYYGDNIYFIEGEEDFYFLKILGTTARAYLNEISLDDFESKKDKIFIKGSNIVVFLVSDMKYFINKFSIRRSS